MKLVETVLCQTRESSPMVWQSVALVERQDKKVPRQVFLPKSSCPTMRIVSVVECKMLRKKFLDLWRHCLRAQEQSMH